MAYRTQGLLEFDTERIPVRGRNLLDRHGLMIATMRLSCQDALRGVLQSLPIPPTGAPESLSAQRSRGPKGWRSQYRGQRDVVIGEVDDRSAEAGGDRIVVAATGGGLRPEHEVVDEQLRAPGE